MKKGRVEFKVRIENLEPAGIHNMVRRGTNQRHRKELAGEGKTS